MVLHVHAKKEKDEEEKKNAERGGKKRNGNIVYYTGPTYESTATTYNGYYYENDTTGTAISYLTVDISGNTCDPGTIPVALVALWCVGVHVSSKLQTKQPTIRIPGTTYI